MIHPTIEHDGYTIKHQPHELAGAGAWIISEDGMNVAPGAALFHTSEGAIRGASALTVARAITSDPQEQGRVFHALCRLAGPIDQ